MKLLDCDYTRYFSNTDIINRRSRIQRHNLESFMNMYSPELLLIKRI